MRTVILVCRLGAKQDGEMRVMRVMGACGSVAVLVVADARGGLGVWSWWFRPWPDDPGIMILVTWMSPSRGGLVACVASRCKRLGCLCEMARYWVPMVMQLPRRAGTCLTARYHKRIIS